MMTAEVIAFPVMIAHILECPNVSQADAEAWADFTLADLWERGFKVVPLEDGD